MATKKKEVKKMTQSTANKTSTENDDIELYQSMIAEAAYYKAESRGFTPGHEAEDWLEAEQEIMSSLQKPIISEGAFIDK